MYESMLTRWPESVYQIADFLFMSIIKDHKIGKIIFGLFARSKNKVMVWILHKVVVLITKWITADSKIKRKGKKKAPEEAEKKKAPEEAEKKAEIKKKQEEVKKKKNDLKKKTQKDSDDNDDDDDSDDDDGATSGYKSKRARRLPEKKGEKLRRLAIKNNTLH